MIGPLFALQKRINAGHKYVIVMKIPVNLIHPDTNKELKFNNESKN